MTVIVDANIIVSALINPLGKEASIIFDHADIIDFAAPDLIYTGILSKKNRIISQSHHTVQTFIQSFELLLNNISIFSVEKYEGNVLQIAGQLTRQVHPKDTQYVALSIILEGLLWTGDLKLLRGLKRKGFENVITTADLQQILKGL